MTAFNDFPQIKADDDQTLAGFYRYADRLFDARKLCLREGTIDKEMMICLINYVNHLTASGK